MSTCEQGTDRSSSENSVYQVLIRQLTIDVTLEQQLGAGGGGESFKAKVR
jgi:hypothetical protein